MKCLTVLFFIAALCATGNALKCYECSDTSTCSDPFDKSGTGVREVDFYPGCYCSKLVINSGGKTVTQRSCLILPTYDANSRASTSDHLSLNLCADDLCNGATATQITLALLAMPLIFLLWQ